MLRAGRRPGVILLVLLGGVCLNGGQAQARDSDRSWEVGVYTSGSTFSGATEINSAFPGFGVRGGYHFKAIHELEFDFDKADADHKEDQTITFDISKSSISYVRNFLAKGKEKMTPFITFGLGKIKVTREQDPAPPGSDKRQDRTSSLLRLGGGLKYFYTPHVGLRFDAKIFHWRGDDVVVPRQGFYTFDATLAVAILLGGSK